MQVSILDLSQLEEEISEENCVHSNVDRSCDVFTENKQNYIDLDSIFDQWHEDVDLYYDIATHNYQ